jgi:hypothetical protein
VLVPAFVDQSLTHLESKRNPSFTVSIVHLITVLYTVAVVGVISQGSKGEAITGVQGFEYLPERTRISSFDDATHQWTPRNGADDFAEKAKTTKKIVLRLECSSCKTKKQLAIKRCKHFELGCVLYHWAKL